MKHRILVVDDDELVRTGLASDLAREGFLVETAAGGEAALAALQKQPVDLVICDLVLGDLDGIDVLRRIKAKWPDTAVVMITGHASIRNALDALRSGASDYLAKPADPEEVVHRLRTVLDAEHLRRSLAAERARAEARRRETQDLLIRNERMASIGTLATGAAEDLQRLLAPIQKHVDELRAALPPDRGACQDLLHAVDEAVSRAAAALADLKAIGTGIAYEKTAISFNQLIERHLKSEEFRKVHQSMGKAKVDLRLDPVVPPILGSEKAMENCIAHLVAYALENVAHGGLVQIETRVERVEHAVGRYGSAAPGEYAVMAVRDSGPALSPEDLERLVEPFYVRAAMGRRFVSGLGMTLVHRIVTDHGGFMDARAEPGVGNTYVLYLPVSSGEATLDLRPDYTGTEQILVVDDYEEHRRVAGDILRDLGYRVVTASSGREAVRLFESALRENPRGIDLAVIDLVLGDDFDGVETYKRMIELRPGQPAVLVSGFADIARIVEARKLGIRQSVQKPYTTEKLGAAVRAALDA
jgi:DNA-binding response OmpR family regulator